MLITIAILLLGVWLLGLLGLYQIGNVFHLFLLAGLWLLLLAFALARDAVLRPPPPPDKQ